MTAYWTGDIAAPLEVEPTNAGTLIDLDPFDTVDVNLYDPDGVAAEDAPEAIITDDAVVIDWGDSEARFFSPGIWTVQLELVGADTTVRSDVIPIVVQEFTGWHDLGSARAAWIDAPDDDWRLYQILDIARAECARYAPTLAEDAIVPVNYREGQIMQARNLWNGREVAPSGDTGTDTFVLRPFPLDWLIKQVLRPTRAVPKVR